MTGILMNCHLTISDWDNKNYDKYTVLNACSC